MTFICDKCNREFGNKGSFKTHFKSCGNFNKCLKCNKDTKNKKFCSKQCSASFNTLGRTHTIETKNKISKTLGGSGNITIKYCKFCNKVVPKERKFCDEVCRNNYILEFVINIPYEQKAFNVRRKIKWELQGKKCIKCGFNLYDIILGPYDLHHIDGNHYNKNFENEEILCRNCHYMTPNHGFKGKHHSKESKEKIKKNGEIYRQQFFKLKGEYKNE